MVHRGRAKSKETRRNDEEWTQREGEKKRCIIRKENVKQSLGKREAYPRQ